MAAIALGANLPSRFGLGLEANLREAVERISALGEIVAISSFYETDPVGFIDQPRFLNGAMLLATELGPLELIRGLLAIERAMGRDRTAVASGSVPAKGFALKGPRVIDLDLLLMGDLVMTTSELTLPHPAMAERRFVLEPLAEIAPGMVDPVSRRTVLELLDQLTE
jgi:2-amino-4-hydroxy-6-hydroxymethyldihydropteridine diphosphokinase